LGFEFVGLKFTKKDIVSEGLSLWNLLELLIEFLAL